MLMRSGPGCCRLVEERDVCPLRQPSRRSSGGQLSLRQQQRRSDRHGDARFRSPEITKKKKGNLKSSTVRSKQQSRHLICMCVHQVVSGWAGPVSAPTMTCLFTWPKFTPTTTPPCTGETAAETAGPSCTASPTDTSGTPCQV